jgi:uncharacterized peroxidase-related enzyme
MPWIRVLNEDEADNELKRIYERIRRSRGRISNILRSQSLNPKALAAHLDLYLQVMFGGGGLTRLQREMIAVTVSRSNQCEYCVAHHSAAMRNYVKDEEFVTKFAEDYRDVKLEPRVKAMLDYALKLTNRPNSVTGKDVGRLRMAGFDDPEILQIALVVSYFNFVNRLASGLGVGLEEERGVGYRY